ncbi:MAG TPA: hypothetical protein ENJ95_04980 [Bacteroidetes bacterium]|nr:hypothetical protein [Bacteroidota bacterium]
MEKSIYHIIQSILLAAALTCLLIAVATYILGENNFLQNSAYPAFGITAILATLLFRLPQGDA